MMHQGMIVALSMMMASLPLPPVASGAAPTAAPPGGPFTRYCLRVDPITGSNMETIQCRTREEWADLDVNVDAEWAQNGVRVIG
jgi:hypothetical protein